jgi:hypothetical protein
MILTQSPPLMAHLQGQYHLVRTVKSPQLGAAVRMTGHAQMGQLSKGWLAYREQGTYRQHQANQAFYQERYFVVEEGTLKILTADRRILHIFPTHGAGATLLDSTHTHICGQDRYTAQLEVHPAGLTWRYQVSGPHKRCIINTILKKKSSP